MAEDRKSALREAEDRKSAVGHRPQNRLDSLHAHQKKLRDETSAIEKQIFDLETKFLHETQISEGGSVWPHGKPIGRERIFSASSLTSPISQAGGREKHPIVIEEEEAGPKATAASAQGPSPGTTTKCQSPASEQKKTTKSRSSASRQKKTTKTQSSATK